MNDLELRELHSPKVVVVLVGQLVGPIDLRDRLEIDRPAKEREPATSRVAHLIVGVVVERTDESRQRWGYSVAARRGRELRGMSADHRLVVSGDLGYGLVPRQPFELVGGHSRGQARRGPQGGLIRRKTHRACCRWAAGPPC